jgi:hypothetical protein
LKIRDKNTKMSLDYEAWKQSMKPRVQALWTDIKQNPENPFLLLMNVEHGSAFFNEKFGGPELSYETELDLSFFILMSSGLVNDPVQSDEVRE